jgi:CBS domain-containing protein
VFLPAYQLNGIWLALIGWFVLGASRRERGAVRVKLALDGLRVGDVMHPVAVVAPAYAALEDLVEQYMRPGRLECCPLVDLNGAVVGLVNSDQLAAVSPEHWRFARASELAWPLASLCQVAPGDALNTVLDRLPSSTSRCALVFEDGRLLGTLTSHDVERALRSPAVLRGHSQGSFAAGIR